MAKKKNKWLYRALCAALAVTLVSGTAVMSPIADIIGTNITANAAGYTTWGNCQWKVENGKLYIKGTIPNIGSFVNIPWFADRIRNTITKVYVEEGAKLSADASYLFYNLTRATTMDLSNLDTSAATNMKSMFYNCKKLTTLNLSSWNTSSVTSMESMFNTCESLTSLNTSGWNISKVTDMRDMFCDCDALTSLDLSSWKTSSVTTMEDMFYGCNALTSLDLSSWKTSSVTTMEGMFYGCDALTSLNLSNWDTKNVTTMGQMFYGCNSLKSVDVNGWNTKNVTDMFCMFSGCKALKKIYADKNWDTSNVDNDYSMFGNCENLVGGKGTAWSNTKKTKAYARIDGGPESTTPGYFTKGHAPSTSYTVTWMDGTTLLCTSSVAEGESPVYNGETPTKDGCIFTGWKDDNGTFYANGTVLPNVTADTTYTAVFDKEITVGAKFYIRDAFNTNGSKYVMYNVYNSTHSFNNRAVVSTPTYHKAENYWYFADMIREGWGFSLVDNAFNGTETVTGFRCVSGDGSSSSTAFKFEPIYEKETNTCEMDFSDVETSIVSIKDADENTVSLNNGKATIKTGYVITSSKPLSFPRTYAAQQDDESNFVYVIKNMIQGDKQVSYDTSAFKGKVTSYIGGGVKVEGYKGTSAQLVQKNAYYGESVSMDLSHGTRLIGQNDYYDDPLNEFFDIYNSDGENITDLFEFSNMAGGSANYYYYKLKQNLEDDITVFPVGTKFTLTLPEGVEIANKDVIVSQEGNVYTIKPTANVTLLSDNLLNIYNGSTLLVADIKYSAVKNHQFVYEVNVTNQINAEISTASIIRTQEELANAKTGDYVMPTETLNINAAGYGWCDVSKYLQASDGYYGRGIGSSLGNYATATIGNDLIIYLNASYSDGIERYVPANPDLCTSGRYDIETYKGNAWRVNFVGTKYNYHAIELTGANYVEPSEYEFTWADDKKSATVTFNNEEPVDAVVELTPDYENKQFICTATAEYNGIPYIETTTVSFPNLADVADVAVDDIVINQDMPTVTVTDTATNTVLELDKDYTVEYSGDTTNAGTATVTITAKDGSTYIGSKSVKFAVLPREMKVSITNRRKAGNNAKATLSGEWYLPKNATNIKAGIARLSTDDTNVTKYDVYNNGVKKASALKTTSGKYSFSLLMNSTHANQNLYAVTYVTYEIDGVPFVSLSKAFTSYPNPV